MTSCMLVLITVLYFSCLSFSPLPGAAINDKTEEDAGLRGSLLQSFDSESRAKAFEQGKRNVPTITSQKSFPSSESTIVNSLGSFRGIAHGKANFDHDFAMVMAELASAAYTSDHAQLRLWNCSRCRRKRIRNFQIEELIIDPKALLEVFVGYHVERSAIAVVFRGTNAHYFPNWISDLTATELNLDYPGVDHALVHKGFYSAYHLTTLRPRITQLVLELRKRKRFARVAVTGHSLGAALATLCSLDLAVNFGVTDLDVITFGSPRVGNQVFSEFVVSKVPRSFRVTHWKDIVVHLPPPAVAYASRFSYHHVAREVWYYRPAPKVRKESFRVCDESGEDPTCSISMHRRSIWDHLTYMGLPMCTHPHDPVKLAKSIEFDVAKAMKW